MKSCRTLRRHLAVTTILSVAPFLGYGRQAFASCDPLPSSPSTFICSGSSTGQLITTNNADVSTAPGFSVNPGGMGISIVAAGDLSFTDENASTITAGGTAGILVFSNGDDGATEGAVTVTTNGHITANLVGIYTSNNGNGSTQITADGIVESSSTGILATQFGAGEDMTITTGAGSVVSSLFGSGIYGGNKGDGALAITVNGEVNGYGLGVGGRNYGTDLTITTSAQSKITAEGGTGISASNRGDGDLTITANGTVGGTAVIGIYAQNYGDDLTITTEKEVHGSSIGIFALNRGSGDLAITVRGDVTAGPGGTALAAVGYGTKLVVTAEGLVQGDYGIVTQKFNSGDLEIIVNGTVTGNNIDNKYSSGIDSGHYGDGVTNIRIGAGGLVNGHNSGIDAASSDGQKIEITNDGVVRNLSGSSFDLAIRTRDGPTTIDNNNLLIGTVKLGNLGNTLNNAGQWNVGGYNAQASDFGTGFDTVNNSGILRAAHDGSTAETIQIHNLENFNNSGVITLVDGLASDALDMDGLFDFVGQGGTIAVDAFLDPLVGASDLLVLQGNSSGKTNIVVNLTNPIGSSPNTDGIRVIIVDGDTSIEDFQIEGGVLNAGFFAWGLKLEDDTYYLYTTGLGAGSYEFAAGVTGAQDIWHQSTGVLLQRQADLRALLAGTQVTPVADFSEPVEPTPVARVTPGLWFKGVGAYLERDQDEANNVSTDRKQEIYGFMAGFDFGSERAGEAWMFGLFGGYVTSDLDFDQSGSEWNYEGPSVGAYATYVDHAFYADVTVKADFLDVDIDDSDIAPAADDIDTDVLNLGGLIDAGYKMPLDHGLFAEPQASLAVVHTEIDDIGDVMGGSVDFEDETSVRGRLGLRLGHELTASNQLIYSSDVTASVWQEFAGDNDVTVAAPGFPVSDVSDSPSETYGDVALGFSVQSPEGWSSFIRANYQFAEDYDAFAGNAGVRYAW